MGIPVRDYVCPLGEHFGTVNGQYKDISGAYNPNQKYIICMSGSSECSNLEKCKSDFKPEYKRVLKRKTI